MRLNDIINRNVEISQFRFFLTKYIKSNGDLLLPSSIQIYTYYIKDFMPEISACKNDKDLIEVLNKFIKIKAHDNVRQAIKLYLEYKKYDVNEDNPNSIVKYLAKVKDRSNAITSQRYRAKKVITNKEMQLLFDGTTDLQIKTVLSFFFDTGLRRYELLNIRFKHIEFMSPNNADHKKDLDAGICAHVFILGKGAKPRTVYLHETSLLLLAQLHPPSEYDPEKRIFVFYKNEKDKIKYLREDQYLYEQIRALGYKILDKKFHPHMCRHTAITNWTKQGLSLKGIQNMAGHSSMTTTEHYQADSQEYGHNAMLQSNKDYVGDIVNKKD